MVDEDNIGGHTTQQQEHNTTTDATADDNADSMGAAQSFNIDVRFTSFINLLNQCFQNVKHLLIS